MLFADPALAEGGDVDLGYVLPTITRIAYLPNIVVAVVVNGTGDCLIHITENNFSKTIA